MYLKIFLDFQGCIQKLENDEETCYYYYYYYCKIISDVKLFYKFKRKKKVTWVEPNQVSIQDISLAYPDTLTNF